MQKRVEYSEAVETTFTEAISYAIAKDENGIANPITLGWLMRTSFEPPMLAIAVSLKAYSCETIRRSGCFTIAFPNEAQIKEAHFFGTHSGKNMDKLKEFGTATSPAAEIDSVILDDASANFECVLECELVTGDHVIFAGRVVASHLRADFAGF